MLDQIRDQLEAIPKDEIRRPGVPIATALQEANDILELCNSPKIRQALACVGIEASVLDDLAVRLRAAREAQSDWISIRDRQKPAHLAALEERAIVLRRRMLAAGRFAFRGMRGPQAALTSVRGGTGVDDLVQDLFDLAGLVNKHVEAFESDRSFDAKAAICEARGLGRELSRAVSGARNGVRLTAARELRDRALSHLGELVAELRTVGRYAFLDDPETAKLFASRHLRKRRLQLKGAEPESITSASAPAPSAEEPGDDLAESA